MTDKTEVNILDLGKCFSYLNSLGDDQVYLTPQGIGLMEGMILTNPEVEVVSQEKHSNYVLDNQNNLKKLESFWTREKRKVEELKERNKELYSKLYFWQK
jgi:hypothetical protein